MLATLLLANPRIARSRLVDLLGAQLAALQTPHLARLWSATCPSALGEAGSGVLLAASSSVAEQATSGPATSSARGVSASDGGGDANSSADSDSGGGGHWSRRWQPLLLAPGAVAACLGYWQLQRRQEKSEMLDRRRAAMEVRRYTLRSRST